MEMKRSNTQFVDRNYRLIGLLEEHRDIKESQHIF